MDDLVLQAMQRWPGVPAVYGWLRLDRRGRWLLVDRGQPDFDEDLHGLGSPITNPQITSFIARNYLHDEAGRWYWQNGPQRVFVDLEIAPLILRVLGDGAQARLLTHTGETIHRIDAAWSTPEGDLRLDTDLGPAVIHDLDLAALALNPSEGDDERLVLTLLGSTLPVLERSGAHAKGFDSRPRPRTPG